MHLSVPVSHWDRFSFLIRRKSLLTSQHMRPPPNICGSVIPTGETDAAALQAFTNIATNSFFWIFNIYVAGTSIETPPHPQRLAHIQLLFQMLLLWTSW